MPCNASACEGRSTLHLQRTNDLPYVADVHPSSPVAVEAGKDACVTSRTLRRSFRLPTQSPSPSSLSRYVAIQHG